MTSVAGSRRVDKIIGIELLRFLSAVSVLVFHYCLYFKMAITGNNAGSFETERLPFYSFLKLLYGEGGRGVQVFWCISGFIFFLKYAESIGQGKVNGKKFFILRFSRLYPLHFVTLILVAVLQLVYFSKNSSYFAYQYNDWYHFALQLFMASSWGFEKAFTFNGPIWSISVEILVYALFFFTLSRFGASLASMALIAALAGLIFVSHLTFHPFFSCTLLFYIGGFTALTFRQVENKKIDGRLVSLSALLVILVSGAVALLTAKTSIKISPYWFVLICSPGLIWLCARHLQVSSRYAAILEALGNMTYSSYLLHFPFLLALVSYFSYTNKPIPVYEPMFLLFFIGVTLTSSYFCYRFVEIPSQNWIREILI